MRTACVVCSDSREVGSALRPCRPRMLVRGTKESPPMAGQKRLQSTLRLLTSSPRSAVASLPLVFRKRQCQQPKEKPAKGVSGLKLSGSNDNMLCDADCLVNTTLACWRRFNSDQWSRLNFDQALWPYGRHWCERL